MTSPLSQLCSHLQRPLAHPAWVVIFSPGPLIPLISNYHCQPHDHSWIPSSTLPGSDTLARHHCCPFPTAQMPSSPHLGSNTPGWVAAALAAGFSIPYTDAFSTVPRLWYPASGLPSPRVETFLNFSGSYTMLGYPLHKCLKCLFIFLGL